MAPILPPTAPTKAAYDAQDAAFANSTQAFALGQAQKVLSIVLDSGALDAKGTKDVKQALDKLGESLDGVTAKSAGLKEKAEKATAAAVKAANARVKAETGDKSRTQELDRDTYEVKNLAQRSAMVTGMSDVASRAVIKEPVPNPSRTTKASDDPKLKGNVDPKKWGDNTPLGDVKVTKDDAGAVKVVSFRANMEIDLDGYPHLVGKQVYQKAYDKAYPDALKKAEEDVAKASPPPKDPAAEAQRQAHATANRAGMKAMRDEVAAKNAEAKKAGQPEDWIPDTSGLGPTSLHWKGTKSVDPSKVPFIALPAEIRNLGSPAVQPGDLVAVTYRGKTIYAVYGDGGPSYSAKDGKLAKAGEASLRVHFAFDRARDAKGKVTPNDGLDANAVSYVVLPGSGKGIQNGPELSFEDIQLEGARRFAQARKDGLIQ